MYDSSTQVYKHEIYFFFNYKIFQHINFITFDYCFTGMSPSSFKAYTKYSSNAKNSINKVWKINNARRSRKNDTTGLRKPV